MKMTDLFKYHKFTTVHFKRFQWFFAKYVNINFCISRCKLLPKLSLILSYCLLRLFLVQYLHKFLRISRNSSNNSLRNWIKFFNIQPFKQPIPFSLSKKKKLHRYSSTRNDESRGNYRQWKILKNKRRKAKRSVVARSVALYKPQNHAVKSRRGETDWGKKTRRCKNRWDEEPPREGSKRRTEKKREKRKKRGGRRKRERGDYRWIAWQTNGKWAGGEDGEEDDWGWRPAELFLICN